MSLSGDNKVRIVDIAADALTKLYEITVSILLEGIKTGKVNIVSGHICLRLFLDLLHGGAYTIPPSQLPYYQGAALPIAVTPIQLPLLASEAQKEVMLDSEAPHVFPKLISDQCYFHCIDLIDKAFTIQAFQAASTGIRTLVEAPAAVLRAERGIGGLRRTPITLTETKED